MRPTPPAISITESDSAWPVRASFNPISRAAVAAAATGATR